MSRLSSRDRCADHSLWKSGEKRDSHEWHCRTFVALKSGDTIRMALPCDEGHVGARYYDPSSGRFLQRDPIGIKGGTNVYAYVFNRPTVDVDPTGNGFWGDVWSGVKIVGGVIGVGVGGLLIGVGMSGSAPVCGLLPKM